MIEQRRLRGAKDVVYLVHLVKLIISREDREQREHFEKHTADPPDVHFVPVVAVCQEALGSAIPACRDVFLQTRVRLRNAYSKRRLRVHAATAAEVGELDGIVTE